MPLTPQQMAEFQRLKKSQTPAKGSSVMGINVASDRKAGIKYADLIVDGHKTMESRNSDTLRPYVGKRVAIVRTGEGPAKAIGEVTIGEPMVVNKKKFRSLESEHKVPQGSAFDINTPTKYLYPLHDPERYEEERDVGHGIVSRKLITKAKGGLAKFLEPSKVKDAMYHGSLSDITKFKPQDKGTFLSPSPEFASTHAKESRKSVSDNPSVYKVHAQVHNPFDFENLTHLHKLKNRISSHWHPNIEAFERAVDDGRKIPNSWQFMESNDIQKAIKDMGHDSYHVSENGVKNLAVYDPRKIKSAIGNRGTYDINDPDITKAKGGSIEANKQMIEDVYGKYPVHPFNPNQRAMVEGEGENQTLGTFELKPSMSARNAVDLYWLSAYPHKQGVGSRTLKKLQEHATEHGVSMTLFPWEHGGVSQAKLMKFYKKHGFVPTVKGGKAMIWHPEKKSRGGRVTHAHHLEIEERPL